MNMDNNQSLGKSKLFRLKKWLTILETANHLSIMFGEEVKEADVLRLVLDGHLKLSVNFVNYAHAKCGEKFLPFEEWEIKFRKMASWQTARALATMDGKIAFYFPGFDSVFYLKDDALIKDKGPWRFGQEEDLKSAFLNKLSPEAQSELLSNMIEHAIVEHQKQSEKFEGKVPPSTDSFRGKVLTLKGVWDLPMLGTERLDIEHEYQMLTNGPEITLKGLDGALVEGEDGVICQLQERFSHADPFCNNYKLSDFEKKIVAAGTITEDRLLEKKKERANRPYNHPGNYYPAGGLPRDSFLVVRSQALIDLQERLSSKDSAKKKPLGIRAETTYLNIIGALLEVITGESPGISKHPDFSSEAKLIGHLSNFGIPGLSKTTLELKFAEAKRSIISNS